MDDKYGISHMSASEALARLKKVCEPMRLTCAEIALELRKVGLIVRDAKTTLPRKNKPGAGRPSLGRVPLGVTVLPETLAWLSYIVAKTGISRGELFDLWAKDNILLTKLK